MRVALVGQPNSGKSTLFNALVGLRAVASNFPGTTVEILRGRTALAGKPAEIVDLPGIYSLFAQDPAERVAREFLLSEKIDVIINVVDASLLSRSLVLTLELMELGVPMVVVLNMADEAEHKGVRIDAEKLTKILGVPVVFTVASRGIGLKELVSVLSQARVPPNPRYSDRLEALIPKLSAFAQDDHELRKLPGRYAALALLQQGQDLPSFAKEALAAWGVEDSAELLADERFALAGRIFREVTTLTHARVGIREQLDDVLMHPVFGYVFLALALFLLFFLTFRVGSALEELIFPVLEGFSARAVEALAGNWAGQLLAGALDGLLAGMAIAIPYLLPFFALLALLEDVGYLPRVGFLLDSLMHRLGLHGKSVIPLLLGYGCSVPAVLATRILEDERDRFVSAVLAVLIPCAARTVVIHGLAGRFLGPAVALSLYLGNVVVVAVGAALLGRIFPAVGPGLILEIPPYRAPTIRTTLGKTWLRLREFVKVAWPLLVLSSLVLALFQALDWEGILTTVSKAFTWPLGLPEEAGVPLMFGVLRKELALLLLAQALGTADFATVLTQAQMLVFTVFTMFYLPCVATVAVLGREMGWRRTGLVILVTTGLALLLGLIVRLLALAVL